MSTLRFAGRKWLFASFFVLGLAAILAGSYIVGLIFLPSAIKINYQKRDCDRALQLFAAYSGFYFDASGERAGVSNLVIECATYNLAVYREEQKAWQDAYNADKTYLESYPSGIFYDEVYTQIARVLIAWAKDLYSQKDYHASIGKLEQVVQSYADTVAAWEAGDLQAEIYRNWSGNLFVSRNYAGALDVLNEYLLWAQINHREEDVKVAKDSFAPLYLGWGSELRNSDDFAGAERTLHQLQDWARANQQPEIIDVANYELAQTYLEWALDLQSQQMFSDARYRLEQAIAVSPEPQSDTGPAAQSKVAMLSVYLNWGDMLIAQNDFPGGLSQYNAALELSDDENRASARDAVLHGYLVWADALVKDEDFIQALEKIKLAGADPGTDTGKNDVEAARAKIYAAFSNSQGQQAQQAMKAAMRAVCQGKKQPEFPIFGLDKNKIRASVFGVNTELPENIAATTPGEMHYVACVEEAYEITQVKEAVCCKAIYQRINWRVTLYGVSDALEKAKATLLGVEPQDRFETRLFNPLEYIVGSPPSAADLAQWLMTVMK
ncbi:MAG TPA: hypothetical protein DCG54_00875 [Anaerolineae bacterium]|jgi:tetratricopeptide (TPR) repeat protein|nr:hypothetical protein [Anaerolineae bacterium]